MTDTITYDALAERLRSGEALDTIAIGPEGLVVIYPFSSIKLLREGDGYSIRQVPHQSGPRWANPNERTIGGGEIAIQILVDGAGGNMRDRPVGVKFMDYANQQLSDLTAEQAQNALNKVSEIFLNRPGYIERVETELAEQAAKRNFRS